MWETKDSKIQSLYCFCLNEIRTYKWWWPKAVRTMLWPAFWSSRDNDPQRKAKANGTLNWNWQESGHIDDWWWWEQARWWGACHRQTWEISLAALRRSVLPQHEGKFHGESFRERPSQIIRYCGDAKASYLKLFNFIWHIMLLPAWLKKLKSATTAVSTTVCF